MLHHFKEEDKQEASLNIDGFEYIAHQMIELTKKGEFDKAEVFQRDLEFVLKDLVRLANKKQEADKIMLLLRQIDGQRQIDSWKEHYQV